MFLRKRSRYICFLAHDVDPVEILRSRSKSDSESLQSMEINIVLDLCMSRAQRAERRSCSGYCVGVVAIVAVVAVMVVVEYGVP